MHVIHQENKGVSVSRNADINAASGECISFLDAGEMLTSNALAHLKEAMDNADADMMLGRLVHTSSVGSDREEAVSFNKVHFAGVEFF